MDKYGWPEKYMRFFLGQYGYIQGASACRRGHVERTDITPVELEIKEDSKCIECGAVIFKCCPNCSFRIRGDAQRSGGWDLSNWALPAFCDQCGNAYPWATRKERIWELENLLTEHGLEEAAILIVREQLNKLLEEEPSDKLERSVWKIVKERTGALMSNPQVAQIVTTLITAGARHELGI